MKLLFTTLAVLILLLSTVLGTSVQTVSDEYEDYSNDCDNDSLILHLTDSRITINAIDAPKIRCLTIDYNGLETIDDGAFDQVPNLEYLNLEGNTILPNNLFSFGNLTNIKTLILGNQNYYYTGLMRVTGVYPKLRYLDLKNCGISDVECEMKNCFPELTHLDFSSNSLVYLYTSFENVFYGKLKYLRLDDNILQQVSFTNNLNLSSLSLNNNKISIIGSSGLNLTGLKNLQNLSVAVNSIRLIEEKAFTDTINLRYLNISMNNLTILNDETFKNLSSLQVLILDQNMFDSVPIITSTSIMTFSMNCNIVKHLTSSSFFNLPNMRKLFLGSNMISFIQLDTFVNQKVLEELYLNDNELSSLPNGWCNNMKELRHLDLSRNKFTSLNPLFQCSNFPVQRVIFDHNPLEYINTDTIKTMPKNVKIYLNYNLNLTVPLCSNL
ncbi:insulin-like growth factor-binding protein complex acid labile subunit [Colletes gigas]|uniref:insulin-like growth factor-binding protein complex acid labile subunit n=1 Tax=Colletes gigas TaxID=935657 RepID=UPI001C9A92C8|nr:insulin-like growth factor-binding protein complex acid labile subunit [Colletes gigas]